MLRFLKSALLLLTAAISCGQSAAIDYLDTPELVWSARVDGVLNGNGVFTSPDDSITVVTQSSGTIDAFDTFSGKSLWSFTPPKNGNLQFSCVGGATFSKKGSIDYIAYSVVDDPNGVTSFTRVISLSFDGELNWISTPLEGAAAGSAVVSFDGRYVFLTHNSNSLSVGHFSVLDTVGASTNTSVLPIYSEFNATYPFSPPGIYHNPAEGYYDGGQGNTNDLVIWSFAPKPLESQVGVGAAFVFQFPIGYVAPNEADSRQADQDGDDDFARRLFWIMLGDDVKDWQAVSAPVLTNMGRSLYWSVSRSQFRGWVGSSSNSIARFNRGRTGGPTFGRGSPRYAACPNTPALSSSTTEPMVFAGTAANEFVKMDFLMKNNTYIVRNTTSKVSAKAIVSPDDQYVYFTEFTGVLHQASTADLVDNWNLTNIGVQDGEFAMTSDGSMIIVGDATGSVQAFQVAPLPAKAPTNAPSEQPTTITQPNPTLGFRPTVPAPTFGFPQPLPSPTVKPTFSPIFNTIPTITEAPGESGGVQTTLPLLWIALVAMLALMA